MKISYFNNNIYLITNDGSLWSFSAQLPIGYVHLCECITSNENAIKESGVELSKEALNGIRANIDSYGHPKEPNYNKVCEILRKELNISKEKLNEIFRYDEDAIELYKTVDKDWLYDSQLYDKCFEYLKKWNGDKDRAKRFINRFCGRYDGTLVDVWPSEEDKKRPTWESESWLLHKFHRDWGEQLDMIIKEAVAKYPDFIDIDYAGYYVDEKLKEKHERI